MIEAGIPVSYGLVSGVDYDSPEDLLGLNFPQDFLCQCPDSDKRMILDRALVILESSHE